MHFLTLPCWSRVGAHVKGQEAGRQAAGRSLAGRQQLQSRQLKRPFNVSVLIESLTNRTVVINKKRYFCNFLTYFLYSTRVLAFKFFFFWYHFLSHVIAFFFSVESLDFSFPSIHPTAISFVCFWNYTYHLAVTLCLSTN